MFWEKRLSLCILIKNDEKNISGCLQDLGEIADEIVIADTGSSDRTVEIAEQAGARVYRMEWRNNYSEAKNLCLDHARGRWILFLWANETISGEQLKELDSLLDNPNVEGYLLYTDNDPEKCSISSPVQSLRLFRNRREYRYQYRTFERIPDEVLTNIEESGIRITRRGDSPISDDSRLQIMLLEEELAEYPEDGYLQYIYGIELVNRQRFEESIAYFQKALQNINYDCLYAPHLLKCLSWSFIYLQRHTEAMEVLEEGIKAFPFYSDFFVLRGELHKQLKQYGEAIRDLKDCLKIEEQSNTVVPAPETDTFVVFELLGEVHEQVFNYRQALDCYRQAYMSGSTNPELLYKIAGLVEKTGGADGMGNLLNTAIKQKNSEQLMILVDILFRQREYTRILACMEQLESVLEKGELLESIKFSCYMLMGEAQEAELHFSAIDKRSPFFGYILLQRIEYCWLLDKWPDALRLLKEMDRTKSIERPVKALYRLLNRLFAGKETYVPVLGQQEYEIVSTLHDNFLGQEQEEKAKALLPLLLEGQEDCCIHLAESWSKWDNFEIIQVLFRCISNKEKQAEFKQKIIERLLYGGYVKTARKLMELGEPQPLGVLEYILRSEDFVVELEEWIGKVFGRTEIADRIVPIVSKAKDKPGKALADFYNSLGISGDDMNMASSRHSAAELTCTDVHAEIGRFYEKAQKKREALSAYMRALQCEPQNEPVQERIIEIFHEDTAFFHAFLEGKEWDLEGSRFHHKQELIYYIQGFIYLKNQMLEEALTYFCQIAEDDAGYSTALAYNISCLWILGRKAEAETLLVKQGDNAYIVSLFLCICISYALYRLDEGHRQYPYSELIMEEKERICNRSR